MAGMKKNSGLGRGLDALLGDYTAASQTSSVNEIDIQLLDTNPGQPRKDFDRERLQELADSIRQHGVVQPIVARPNGGRYTIVTGERRYRAARLAGLKTVPVVVKEFDEQQVMEVALIENIQREDLNPVEEAAAIRFLMDQHDLTQEEVSQRLSKSRPAIANALRLLNLAPAVLDLVREGKLSAGHGRALAAVGDARLQKELANKAVETKCSVRALEQMVKQGLEKKTEKPKPKPLQGEMYHVEERLRERLGTKVKLSGSERRGKIVIEYYSQESLEHIYNLLGE